MSLDILNETRQKIDELGDDDDETLRNLLVLANIKVTGAIRMMYKREPARTAMKNALAANDFTCATLKNADLDTIYKFDVFFS